MLQDQVEGSDQALSLDILYETRVELLLVLSPIFRYLEQTITPLMAVASEIISMLRTLHELI